MRTESLRRWLTHYPRMLRAYRRGGEDGLQELEVHLRTDAAEQPNGKYSKFQAAYVPIVPFPPLGWRHECGRCRFWVDEGPAQPAECMIVEGAIHEKAGCALYMPPAGEDSLDWLREQLNPTGADIVRGEFHPGPHRSGSDRARRRPSERSVGGPIAPAGPRVRLEPVVEGLAAPVAMTFHPSEERRYIADQHGVVYRHETAGLAEEPLLDLRDQVVDLRSQYDERGLLGIALHPEEPRIFLRYSAPAREGTPDTHDHTEVLSAFALEDAGREVDPASEATILEIPSPQFNHNAGAIAFGPDGFLHVAMGDGGNEGDRGRGHVDGGNGQDITENLLGAILRIDVDAGTGDRAYAIPDDNPLVGTAGRDELYAWGLRNPWRLSFDSAGRLFVADVGQHLFEEINLVERGANYGWPIREGVHCFDPEHPTDPPDECPSTSRRGEPLQDPIIEYPHHAAGAIIGSAVIGGYVYEGVAITDLEGRYLFGDWATSQDRPSGRLFVANQSESGERWSMEELTVANTPSGRINRNVLGFARDHAGEVYVLTSESHVPKGETGAVHKLVPA